MYSENFKNVIPDNLPSDQIGDVKIININAYVDANYGDTDPDWDQSSTDLQAWCKEHGVTYYSYSNHFAVRQATRRAEREGNSFALVEDMS